MVYVVTGTLGGGKSLFVAEKAYELWQRGGYVTSNMDFKPDVVGENGWLDRFIDLRGIPITDWINHVVGGQEGAENLVIIDEAGLLFSVDDQQADKQINKMFFEFVVWSRRYGVDIYFVSQDADNVNVKIRRSAGFLIHCVNITHVPLVGKLAAFWLGTFKRYKMTPKKRAILSSSYHRFRPEVGNIYDTHGFVGKNVSVKRHVPPPPKASKAVIFGNLGIAALVAAILIGGYVWKETLFSPEAKKESPSKPKLATVTSKPLREIESPVVMSTLQREHINSVITRKTGWQIFTNGGGRGTIYELGKTNQFGKVIAILSFDGGYRINMDDGTTREVFRRTKEERYAIWKQQQQSLLERSARPIWEAGSSPTASALQSALYQPSERNSP